VRARRGAIFTAPSGRRDSQRSPDTATTEDIRRFQLHLAEADVIICNRNCIMAGLRCLFRVHCGDWILQMRSITFVSPRRYHW
jgi:hypothetical protein